MTSRPRQEEDSVDATSLGEPFESGVRRLQPSVARSVWVSRLSITPVRGLALLQPDSVFVERHGVSDDRRYSLIDSSGRLFDGTKMGGLVQVKATVAHDPERLRLTFPDGSVIDDEVCLGLQRQVEIHGRRFDARPVIGPWSAALSVFAGRPLELIRSERRTADLDRQPVSIVSEASVRMLSAHAGLAVPLDARRFRMLLELGGAQPHQEDRWIGHSLCIGSAVVRVTTPDPRCVITTHDPDTGVRDFATLHALRAYRGLRDGRYIDFGVYGEVVQPGRVRIGDQVVRVS